MLLMVKRELFLVLIGLMLFAGCSGQQNAPKDPGMAPPAADPNVDSGAEEQELVEPTQAAHPPTEIPAPPAEPAVPDCLGKKVNKIGKSIAQEYKSVNYKQVMTWFCNGAEFEDILVALETESQTDRLADELLVMIAEGFSWEEIWQAIGLTD